MDDLYREIILDHYKNPHNFGKLTHPTYSYEQNNPFCGDTIQMDVATQQIKSSNNYIVKEIKFSGVGCAISIASASLLTDIVKGKQIGYLQSLKKDDIVKLLGISLTPTRLKCALLPLEVLQKAVLK